MELFDKIIDKTTHKSYFPSFNKVKRFILNKRKLIVVLFLLLLIPAYIGNSNYKVYYKLDESHALKFFEGGITLKNMLSHVENIESGLDDIKNAKSISDLHKICTENDVYKF